VVIGLRWETIGFERVDAGFVMENDGFATRNARVAT